MTQACSQAETLFRDRMRKSRHGLGSRLQPRPVGRKAHGKAMSQARPGMSGRVLAMSRDDGSGATDDQPHARAGRVLPSARTEVPGVADATAWPSAVSA
jgi:hypothetical protein